MGLPEPPEPGASALPKGSFEGRTVVVTGGGTGLGKAIAVEFARLGASLGILSRKQEHREAGVAAVTEVKIDKNTTGDADLGRQIERIFRKMSFPRPKGGAEVTVTYPFMFAPS